jgi:hypothetical protein
MAEIAVDMGLIAASWALCRSAVYGNAAPNTPGDYISTGLFGQAMG